MSYPYPPSYQPMPAPRKRGKLRKFFLFGCLPLLGLFFLLVVIGVATEGGRQAAKDGYHAATTTTPAAVQSSATQAQPAPVAPPVTKPPPKTTITDGTWLVGSQIEPGTYQTDGSNYPAGLPCYWGRLQGISGQIGDTIANDNITGPTVVTILTSDKAFKTAGCHPWRKIS